MVRTTDTFRILLERQRKHRNLYIPTRQECSYLARKHVGIRTRHIQINCWLQIKTIDDIRKIRDMLYLIKKDVSHLILLDQRFDIRIQFSWVSQFKIVIVLKIEIDDLLLRYSMSYQPVTINLHNGRFTTTADACYHLDKLFILESYQLLQIVMSFYSLHFCIFTCHAANIHIF